MTPKQKQQIIIKFKSELENIGWVKDRWNNFKKETKRIKFKPNIIRYETKGAYGWIRIRSVLYKDLN